MPSPEVTSDVAEQQQSEAPRLAQSEAEIIGLMEAGLNQMMMMNMQPAQLVGSVMLHVGKCIIRAIYATAGHNDMPVSRPASRIVIAG